MTQERHEQHDDPFWTHDVVLAEDVPLRDGPRVRPRAVRARFHVSEETYPHTYGRTEIVPVADEPGTRRYVLAHPYMLVPDITVQIGLYSHPSASGAIGEVTGSTREGMRPLQIGSGQAWYYPADKTIVLWELILHGHARPAHDLPPRRDETYLALWRGFERQLRALFPEATQIATPSWDPDYPSEEWHQLLWTLGYHPATPQAFAKPLPLPDGH